MATLLRRSRKVETHEVQAVNVSMILCVCVLLFFLSEHINCESTHMKMTLSLLLLLSLLFCVVAFVLFNCLKVR